MQPSAHILRLLIATLLLAPACAQRHEASFAGLQPGMTREQVRELLGPPSTTFYDTEVLRAEAGGAYGERWQYGDTISTRATGACFRSAHRVWVVSSTTQSPADRVRREPWRDVK